MTTTSRRQAVFDAAEELKSRGQKPTLDAIREITGGSYSTLGPLLKEWRDQDEARRKEVPEVPSDLTTLAGNLAFSFWATAMKEAEARFAGERELLIAKEGAVRQEYQDLLAAADQHLSDLAEAQTLAKSYQEQIQTLQSTLASTEAAVRDMQAQVDQLQGQCNTAQSSNEEMQQRLEEVSQEATNCKNDKDALIARIANLEGQLSQLEAQNNRLIEAIPGSQKTS